MKHNAWVMVLTTLCFSGCATQGVSTLDHQDMALHEIKNELQVSRPQSEVWDMLVKELSKSFYVINNIDKESRIINISFSSTTPADYVDCGRSHRTYRQGDKTETFDYDIASSTRFKVASRRQEHPAFSNYAVLRRETSLEGRSNIYVAPSEKDKNATVVTVNTRYIMSFKIKGEAFAEHFNGNIIPRGLVPEQTFSIMFNTNQPGQYTGDDGKTISCCSKGKLENEILSTVPGQGR